MKNSLNLLARIIVKNPQLVCVDRTLEPGDDPLIFRGVEHFPVWRDLKHYSFIHVYLIHPGRAQYFLGWQTGFAVQIGFGVVSKMSKYGV